MKKLATFLVLFITGITLFSQTQNIIFNEITDKDRLNQYYNNRALFQDHMGFIWIGSFSGLQRFDGYEFKDYTDKINPKWLYSISEDKRSILWIGSSTGLYLLNPENDKVKYFAPPECTGIFKVYEDKNGIIWCAAAPNGLMRVEPKIKNDGKLKELIFKNGVESAFNISIFKYDSILDINQINDIYEDSHGQLWIGSPEGLFIFDRETNDFIRIDDDGKGKTKLNDQDVREIAEENTDVLWVRSQNGFTRISNIKEALSKTSKGGLNFRHYSTEFTEYTFLIDHKKNFWIGTYNDGLIKLTIDKNQLAFFEELYPEVHDPEYLFGSVTSLMEDRTGLLWAGHDYKGMKTFRVENNPFIRLEGMLKDYPGLRYNFNQIYQDDNGDLWICTWGNGVFKISREGKVKNFNITDPAYPDVNGNLVWMLLEIDRGIFWLSTNTGIYQLNANTGISHRLELPLINRMIKIENFILFRTEGQGLYVYDLETHNINKYLTDQNDTLGLQSNNIFSICELKNGEIWISTYDPPGLNRLSFNKTTGELSLLPLPEAVATNKQIILEHATFIFQIYQDMHGLLWFCTYNGLVKVDLESGEIRKWTAKDGLSDNWVKYVEEDIHGNLWIVTHSGLSMLDPETGIIKTFDASDGLPDIIPGFNPPFQNKEGQIYLGGIGGFYSFHPDSVQYNTIIPLVVITDFRLFNKPVEVDSTRKAVLTKNISYTQEINLKYNQNSLSFTFAALDFNDPSQNRYAYMLEGYQEDWIMTDADNRIATYTNLNPGEYTFRVKGSNNDGVWNEEGTFINIIIRPPFWKTILAYFAYGVLFLLFIRGYIFWRTQRLRKEKAILEQQVSERTQRIEQQKEELLQQKEELQSTLENLQKTQEQLIESEKMAAIGGLVAGVAHEINTPVGIGITAISSLLDDVQKMAGLYEKDEISRKDFKGFLESTNDTAKLIQKNLERTAALVQSFKQVSTDQATEQQRVFALKEYLNDILLSLRPKFREKNIEFKIECDDKLQLNSYPGVYAQIFTNLLLNSLQHGFPERDTGTIGIQADINKELLKIQYTDNGAGISKKDLPHIFEPFYTSDQHRGTGLGLNIIYNLVKQKLQGTISCESEPGKGVLFTIEVPVK